MHNFEGVGHILKNPGTERHCSFCIITFKGGKGLSVGERKRKTRSDKKKDVKPTISIQLKDSVYRLSFITKKPVKDVCEELVLNSLYGNKEILKELSRYFKRTIQFNNTVFRGSLENKTIYDVTGEENERISFRVTQSVHDFLYDLSYVLACSISKVGAILIYESITDGPFIESYLQGYLNSLDPSRKKELKQLIKYIKTEIGEGYNLADLLSYLIEEPINWKFPQ